MLGCMFTVGDLFTNRLGIGATQDLLTEPGENGDQCSRRDNQASSLIAASISAHARTHHLTQPMTTSRALESVGPAFPLKSLLTLGFIAELLMN